MNDEWRDGSWSWISYPDSHDGVQERIVIAKVGWAAGQVFHPAIRAGLPPRLEVLASACVGAILTLESAQFSYNNQSRSRSWRDERIKCYGVDCLAAAGPPSADTHSPCMKFWKNTNLVRSEERRVGKERRYRWRWY